MDLNALTMQVEREHDACGIFAQLEKSEVASRKPIDAGIQALMAMRHRAGYVENEGDGCGLLIDIPRDLWRKRLEESGLDGSLAYNNCFFVGHFLIQRGAYASAESEIQTFLKDNHLSILLTQDALVNINALGSKARVENPVFLQIAGLTEEVSDLSLYHVQEQLEQNPDIHVASLSRYVAVYKVVGDADALYGYYQDLQQDECLSQFVLAHNRYSTNTSTSFSRVQPFSVLGHNGEINTIARFYTEASMLDIVLDANFSDSQMVDRGILALIAKRGWSLFEVAELLFPPIIHEIKQMQENLSDMYMFFRSLWGPFSQGPAAMMIRYGNEAVFSVDALGLRPMWQIETETAFCFSSEQGIVPSDIWISEPKPLAPGEKIGARWILSENGDRKLKLYSYAQLQQEVYKLASSKFHFVGEHRNLHFATSYRQQSTVSHPVRDTKPFAIRAAAFGFRNYDFGLMDSQMRLGAEPIQSLGYDGPIAALSPEMTLLPDYLQETVAVVTNPAIDREREIEHFSTRTILGRRPSLVGLYTDAPRVEVQAPILLEELPNELGLVREEIENIAQRQGTLLYEDALELLRTSPNGTVEILLHRLEGESITASLDRFQIEALEAVQAGANVIVLDDRLQFMRGSHVDPYLATAAVHKALLRSASTQGGEYLRRRSSLILRSGGLRNLHDIVTAIGIGADAVVPYLMWERAGEISGIQGLENLYCALTKGLEKVMSTLGIHEIRGYERLFSSIGLTDELANWLGVPTFCGSNSIGYSIEKMAIQADKRQTVYNAETEKEIKLEKARSYFPNVCKTAAGVAQGKTGYDKFLTVLQSLERNNPISLRHALQIKESSSLSEIPLDEVDTTVDGHAYPFVISSMSFGAQGETSYRAYAEAAHRLNIVCLNGEGGEIKDLLGKNPRNRGREIASGRFGVNAELCNGAYVLEIKIGQGAKPGEGGHLPGSKVTAQVAAARNASPGVDLISPSNNHDIYSIEDLAQVVYELKQVNPDAKVAIKVPVVPNIGTISIGIAKAGADIIELSGFDGGTGAARSHAIRHVGLPMEIGVKLVHDALCDANLRDVVEIWADGGMKSGLDAIKTILLGANRVGFATMAIAAIGCTECRMCKNREICSMFNDPANGEQEACSSHEKCDKTHVLHDLDASVANLERFFTEIGQHIRELTQKLGVKRTQDLVGRRDMLEQVLAGDVLDLTALLSVEEAYIGKGSTVTSRAFSQDAKTVVESVNTIALATGTDGVPVSAEKLGSYAFDSQINAAPRALGVFESGQRIRNRRNPDERDGKTIESFAVAGAGFAAYHTVGMTSIAHGGAQDGVGKTAFGGKIVVLKTPNRSGIMLGGSVGKSVGYGAQHGVFLIQGNADARAGIRLSGADIVIGGEVEEPLEDELAFLGARSNIKGFAFEYMTAGRAVVLGDPGPWMCSGMTGGRVYLRKKPDVGLTEEALRRRLAKGAKVNLLSLDSAGVADVQELLLAYQVELRKSGQLQAAKRLHSLISQPAEHFIMGVPYSTITDQEVFTE